MFQFRDCLLSLFYSTAVLLSIPMMFSHARKITTKANILNVPFTQIYTALDRIKCYCVSDLHADSEKNQVWVRENCRRRGEDKDVFTVMILPGDIGSEIDRLESVFKALIANYNAVVFVPGNHEAWKRGTAAGGSATAPDERAENRMAIDSIVKLEEVLDKARDSGVFVGPVRVQRTTSPPSPGSPSRSGPSPSPLGAIDSIVNAADINPNELSLNKDGVVVFPLYSWYHSTWDKEPEIIHPDYLDVEEAMPFIRKWGDFSMCSWPEEILLHSEFCSTSTDNTVLAEAFAEINEPFLSPLSPLLEDVNQPDDMSDKTVNNIQPKLTSPIVQEDDTIISFSHFLPRQELCPEKRFLLEPLLTKVLGSDFLEKQIRRLKPDLHLFGHTHIPIDLELEGIRYIQWPKGYSREADKQCAPIHRAGPLLVYDSSLGRGTSSFPADSLSLDTVWTRYYTTNKRTPENVMDLAPWVLKRLEGFSGLVRSSKNRIQRSDNDGEL